MKTPSKALLCLILFAGLILRIWGLDFGLPYQFHQDEPVVVNHALAYGTGDLNPHFFAIPPLASYLLFFFYGAFFIAGKLSGLCPSAEDFALRFFQDPTVFYLIGRFFIGVVPGVACVLLTYRFARRFLTERSALYAAAVMAVAFLNVANSHYIYADMLLVMFTMLVFNRLLTLYEKPAMRNYCIAGIFLGLAAGAKYNGALLAVPYFLTHLAVTRRGREKWRNVILSGKVWAGCLSAAAAFLLTNPFAVLDLPGFLGSVLRQSGAFWYTGWGHHIFYSMAEGISLPLTAAGSAGLLLLFFNKGWRGRIFASFAVMFYLMLVFKSQPFSRYVLPLVPFFAIGAAYLIFGFLSERAKPRGLRNALAVAAVLLLLPTLVKSVKADILFSSRDTRAAAADWIKEGLPPGTKIACDSTTFRPALRQPYSQLEEKKAFLESQPALADLKSRKLVLMMKAAENRDKGYPVFFLFEDPEAQGQFLDTVPALPYDIFALREQGIGYVVINGQITDRAKQRFLAELGAAGEKVRDFSPYADGVFRQSRDRTATTCIPVMSRELFSRKSTGPSLRVYRIK